MWGETLHTYSVHQKPETTDFIEPVLVREGFLLWAFLWGPLWLLYHRIWRMAAVFLLLNAALGAMESYGTLSAQSALLLQMLLQLIVGFEASDMRRNALERSGYELIDIVRETSEARAMLRSCDRMLQTAMTQTDSRPTPPLTHS